MTFSDWDINSHGSGVFVGGTDGTSRRHIYLENPITDSGDFCRQWTRVTGTIATLLHFSLKETLDAGKFFEMPSEKISIRARLRLGLNFFPNNTAIGIVAKFDPSSISATTTSPKGYTTLIGDTAETLTNGNIKIVCDNKIGAHSTTQSTPLSTPDEWLKIRMDVTPISATEDLIEVYTGTDGSEDWTLIESKTVLDSDTFWIPWTETNNGKIGFFVLTSNPSDDLFIDNFEVRLG